MTSSSVNIEYRAGVVPADRLGHNAHDALLLFGRVIMALIFVQSGFGKLLDIGAFSANLAGKGVPFASVIGVIGASSSISSSRSLPPFVALLSASSSRQSMPSITASSQALANSRSLLRVLPHDVLRRQTLVLPSLQPFLSRHNRRLSLVIRINLFSTETSPSL